MCGKTPKMPAVVQRDPVAEKAVADTKAANDANAETAALKKRRSRSSLITGAGAEGGALAPSATAGAAAKPTLLGG